MFWIPNTTFGNHLHLSIQSQLGFQLFKLSMASMMSIAPIMTHSGHTHTSTINLFIRAKRHLSLFLHGLFQIFQNNTQISLLKIVYILTINFIISYKKRSCQGVARSFHLFFPSLFIVPRIVLFLCTVFPFIKIAPKISQPFYAFLILLFSPFFMYTRDNMEFVSFLTILCSNS